MKIQIHPFQKVVVHFPLVLLIAVLIPFSAPAQQADTPPLLKSFWPAYWITHPSASCEYGVYHFRKTFTLDKKSDPFVVHISADNRYILFVNGIAVCSGPARGDLFHWRFESLDIAPWLREGKNVIAALVWNFGKYRPWAQLTYRTAFILAGNSDHEKAVNTGQGWKVLKNEGYSPIADFGKLQTFIVIGPGDRVDGTKYPWGWENIEYEDKNWSEVRVLQAGQPYGTGTDLTWTLVPRNIPFMDESILRISSIRKTSGILPDSGFLMGTRELIIPAHKKVSILLDQQFLTTAYPELFVSKGKGSLIQLTYAETLYDLSLPGTDLNAKKGNRNQVEGKEILGITDEFLPDGGTNRHFRPLWFRTYRYIQMDIQTGKEPLAIQHFYGTFTAYPFQAKATFRSPDSTLARIWDIAWRTARLCAHETYFDCPYYEQLQYIGDTRIQALISLYMTGDDRLMRNALELFDNSRIPEGLTQSRYPTAIGQVIPPYSLFWINMIHDFYMLKGDTGYILQFVPGIRNILDWYFQRLDPSTGMLGKVPFWNFVDWPDEWPWDDSKRIGGVPPGADTGGSSITTLQFAYTLKDAAKLMHILSKNREAGTYDSIANCLVKAVRQLCYDPARKLLADTPGKNSFSQHANIMGILTDCFTQEEISGVMNQILNNPTLIQATLYYRFYLFRAMEKAGMANLYLQQLGPWKRMLAQGLTTFAERPDPTRSDCHAWSASPLYDLLSLVAGIKPAQPGFTEVLVEPNPGNLPWFEASMPVPAGMIRIQYRVTEKNLAEWMIELPAPVSGIFRFANQEKLLRPGVNKISLNFF